MKIAGAEVPSFEFIPQTPPKESWTVAEEAPATGIKDFKTKGGNDQLSSIERVKAARVTMSSRGGALARRQHVVEPKYHHARLHLRWREKGREHLTLGFMPPYSPDLNPIERASKLSRRTTLTAVISSVENVFNHSGTPKAMRYKGSGPAGGIISTAYVGVCQHA